MSAEVAPRPGKSSRRPELREVPRREGRIATVPFVLVVALVLGLGMVGMLVLTTALQEQAFAVQRQQHQANVLASQVSQLQAEVADARSVKSLAIAAAKLRTARPAHAFDRLIRSPLRDAGEAVAGRPVSPRPCS